MVLGQDERGGWQAFAAELQLMGARHLHTVHGAHQRQNVTGPGVRPAARPVVVHTHRQVRAHFEGVGGRDELGSARGRHRYQAPFSGGGAGSVCAQVQAPDMGDAVEVGVAELRHGVRDVLVAPRHVPGYRSRGCRPKYGW